MKKNLAVRAGLALAAFALVATPALAATLNVTGYSQTGGGTAFLANFDLVSAGSIVDTGGITIPYSSITDFASIQAQAASRIKAAVLHDDSVTLADADFVWPYTSTSTVQALIDSSISGITQPQAMSFGSTTRSLNSAFQVSSTRAAFVSYTVDVATTLSLTGGATGTVTLQYANDSGFTSGVTTVQSAVNGNTGTLTIGLALTQTGTASISGVIPAGKYVKLVTANTAGTPTFTFRAAQEVLMPSN